MLLLTILVIALVLLWVPTNLGRSSSATPLIEPLLSAPAIDRRPAIGTIAACAISSLVLWCLLLATLYSSITIDNGDFAWLPCITLFPGLFVLVGIVLGWCAIAGDIFRNRRDEYVDLSFETACDLHNLRCDYRLSAAALRKTTIGWARPTLLFPNKSIDYFHDLADHAYRRS